MNVSIRGKNVEVTEALREYAGRKIGRVEKFFEQPIEAEIKVTLTVIKGVHTVEVTIPIQGVTLRAEEKSADMYASIDLVAEKLERQIRKHKTRLNRRLKHDGTSHTAVEGSAVAIHGDGDEEESFDVVKVKRFVLKPMDLEEAVLQMNLIGHTFYMFENTDTHAVNVVYKRADGRYGLIEPAL